MIRSAARRSPSATGTSIRACQTRAACAVIPSIKATWPESRRPTPAAGYSRTLSSYPTAAAIRAPISSDGARTPRSTALTNSWLTPASVATCSWVMPTATRASRYALPSRWRVTRARCMPMSRGLARIERTMPNGSMPSRLPQTRYPRHTGQLLRQVLQLTGVGRNGLLAAPHVLPRHRWPGFASDRSTSSTAARCGGRFVAFGPIESGRGRGVRKSR